MKDRTVGPMLVALALLVSAGCAPRQKMMGPGAPRDVGTPIILLPPEGDPTGCAVSFKQATIRSHADKWLIFDVVSYCESSQTVMVGNFRTEETLRTAPSDCTAAMGPGEAAIFQQDDANRRTARLRGAEPGDPEDERIRLKIRQGAELPGSGDLTYYFDVCLNGPIAQDPRLIIER